MQHIGEIIKSEKFRAYLNRRKESPIEENLVAAMFSFDLTPDTQVEIGKYRADIVLANKDGDKFIVECDGDEWHRDKKREDERDDYLNKKGYNVVHFSGSMINRDPNKCVYDLILRYFPERTQGERFKQYAEKESENAYRESQIALSQEKHDTNKL